MDDTGPTDVCEPAQPFQDEPPESEWADDASACDTSHAEAFVCAEETGEVDDLGIAFAAPLVANAPASAPAARVKLGPLCVPVAVIGWLGSVTVHAAMIAVMALVIRAGHRGPTLEFGKGDGASEFGIHNDATGFAPAGLPTPHEAPAPMSSQAVPGTDDALDESPSTTAFEDVAPAPPTVPPLPADTFIGPGERTSFPIPRRQHNSPPAANDTDVQLASAAATHGAADQSSALAGAGGGGVPEQQGPVGQGGAPSDGGTPGVPAGVAGKGLAVPRYPYESRRRGEQGDVVVEVEVLADGNIGQVRVLADPGFPRLVDAALAAVRKSRFTPAYDGDRPMRATVRVPFRFSLR